MSTTKNEDSNYDMDNDHRGIALVININTYEPNLSDPPLKERKWSIKDVENLTKTLNYLEFDLILKED